ncbi:MAG: hypothetical protein D4S01_00915 [Dehalococcoidia bacterium]|nr:MAG: hypothetical protein D4S01_00915 [Dehalococcoidia bacterium]
MGIFEFDDERTEPNTETKQWEGILDFDDHLMFGYFFKDIIVLLLDKCGYEVYPYGYESFFPNLKRKLYNQPFEEKDSAERIRSTPDLLVKHPDEQRVDLVEVKSRTASGKWGIKINEIKQYRKFWPESILVLVIPYGNYFYAQHISKLDMKSSYAPQDFRPFEEIFPLAAQLPEDFRLKLVRKVRTLCLNRDHANL